MIPRGAVSVIGRFHGAVVVVAAVDLGVAVIEAAPGVIVQAVDDPIGAFCLVVDCCAFCVILAQPHTWRYEDAICLVAHDCDGRHVRDRQVVEAAHSWAAESAARRLGKVIVLRRLIVDHRDPALGLRAKYVLGRRIGIAARIDGRWRHNADVEGLAIGLPHHLVERPVIRCVQRARCAVRSHAGVASRGVDVARAFRPACTGAALRSR